MKIACQEAVTIRCLKHTKHEKHDNYQKLGSMCKDLDASAFHYAGVVYYNITAFLDKNKDQPYEDIVGVLSGSEMPILKSFFEDKSAPALVAVQAPPKDQNSRFAVQDTAQRSHRHPEQHQP